MGAIRLNDILADLSALDRWDLVDPASPASIAAMSAEPRFSKAAWTLGVNMANACVSDKGIAGISKDAGSYVAAMWSIYLHVTGGLTLPSLKALCASSGLLSPGRARAMVLYLRYLRYVEPGPKPAKGAPARYVPTQAFITAWRRHLVAALDAACVAEPALDPFLNRLCEPDAMDILSRIQAEGLHEAIRARADHPNTPLFAIFINRSAGWKILWRLIADSEDGEFPPRRATNVSAAALARSFRVSRIHVRRVLDHADKTRFVYRDQNGMLVFSDNARAEVGAHYAVQLNSLLRSATRTLKELQQVAARELA